MEYRVGVGKVVAEKKWIDEYDGERYLQRERDRERDREREKERDRERYLEIL